VNPGRDSYLDATDGTRIHYHVYEPAKNLTPALLFIHGLGSNWTRWKRLAEEPFFRSYRRLIPDLRGHGESIAREGIDADGISADLELILKKEGIQKPVVVGHCLGANIAVRLWERNPQSVRALILIEPFITEDLQMPWRILQATLGRVLNLLGVLVRAFNALGLRRARFRRIDYSVYDDWVRPRLTNLFSVIRWMGPWMDLQCMPVAAYIASYQVLFRYRPPWNMIRIPVMALIARQGGVLSSESGEPSLDRSGFQKVWIEASHFVLTDNREGVVRAIHAFMENLKRDGLWKS
jgi:pimeloyl-ACP methyl ester carboxylesterase